MKEQLKKVKGFVIRQKKKIAVALIIIVTVLLDQLSKLVTLQNLDYISKNKPITVIGGILNISFTTNDGAAWGMFDDQRWLFMTISTVAIIGIGIYLFGFCKEGWLYQIGLALIIGGGIGNMIDRVAYGYVIDMLEFGFMENFPIFNVADSFVCIGAGLVMLILIIELFKPAKKEEKPQEQVSESALSSLEEPTEENDNN